MAPSEIMKRLAAALIILTTVAANAATLKPVRIDFIEALAPADTTSSERFEKDFEGAIHLGRKLLDKKLSSCGYNLETKTAFYGATDALKAKELATQSEDQGAWLIVGPRRSNHYLLLAQGATKTPTISLMASADAVTALGPEHISLSPTNSEMADIAAKETKSRLGKAATYVTVVSDDCVNCVDFSKAFDHAAINAGLKKVGEIKLHGANPDVGPAKHEIDSLKPAFVLLPNYSLVATSVLSSFNSDKNPPLFVGGDGWGDSKYGFVENGLHVEHVHGFTVRGFPPTNQGLAHFPLGKKALSQPQSPTSAPSMAILKILDSVGDTLCRLKPDSKDSFEKAFETTSLKFKSPWGVSIYDLNAGVLTFRRSQKTL